MKNFPRLLVVSLAGEVSVIPTARFAGPRAAAFDAAGSLHVADSDNPAIRAITPRGEVTTAVGVRPSS